MGSSVSFDDCFMFCDWSCVMVLIWDEVHFVVSFFVVRVCGFVVWNLRWLELNPKKKVDSDLGKAMRILEIDAAMLE